MVQKLEAHEEALSKVFSSDYDFSIPDYQRPYRWGVEQASQLLSDLEESLDRSSDEPYFLGSIVLVRQGDREYDVIDGQQRLTTITILFSVLRELCDSSFSGPLSHLVMEPGNPLLKLQPQPRLTIRPKDQPFFREFIQEPGQLERLISLSDNKADSEPRKAIRDNANHFYMELSEWSEEKRQALASFVTGDTFLVVVKTPDLSSAHRIFSVMNARGLDLSPTDIFKSWVVGAADTDETYAPLWEDAEESLGADEFTDLFRDIRTIASGRRTRGELLKEFPEQVLNQYIEAGKAKDFVNKVLLPYHEAFERTSNCDFPATMEWRPVNNWLKRLGMLDNKDWRPCALWALKNCPDDPVFLSEFLRKLERLAASMLLRRTYTTPRVDRYLELLQQLKDGAGLSAPAFNLSTEEKQEALEALNGDIYRMQSRRARYVLLRLDELLAHSSGATYEHPIITIEHVLPQTPSHDSDWVRNFTPEERTVWTNRIGNLVLLNKRKNSEARNYDFEKKKAKYFTGPKGSAVFALTTQVLQESDWTPEVVENRQTKLVSRLAHEWELV